MSRDSFGVILGGHPRDGAWHPGGHVRQIFLLALGSAGSLAVQLLAVVVVILTRPRPKPLLWAFYVSALVVSVAISSIALAVFRAKGTFLGTTSTKVSPSIYLIVGVVAVAAAAFAATKRGRELIGREVERSQSASKADPEGSISERARAKVEEVKGKADEAMKSGSVWVAIVAGCLLGAPSPFSLGAVGIMVRDGYRLPTQLLLILGFSLVTYIVVEVPLISYAVRPEATAGRVEAFSKWLETNKIQAVAVLAAVVGVVLIVKGLTAH